jgi:hypothetical protein
MSSSSDVTEGTAKVASTGVVVASFIVVSTGDVGAELFSGITIGKFKEKNVTFVGLDI